MQSGNVSGFLLYHDYFLACLRDIFIYSNIYNSYTQTLPEGKGRVKKRYGLGWGILGEKLEVDDGFSYSFVVVAMWVSYTFYILRGKKMDEIVEKNKWENSIFFNVRG